MKTAECAVCGTQGMSHVLRLGPCQKATIDTEQVQVSFCFFCWGPKLINTKCVPIPHHLLWTDGVDSDPSWIRAEVKGL